MVRVITLLLVLRHSIENRSIEVSVKRELTVEQLKLPALKVVAVACGTMVICLEQIWFSGQWSLRRGGTQRFTCIL